MSPPLFLVDALPAGDSARLDGPEGRHAADVQRLRVGETLLLGDGRGTIATATVTSVTRGALDLRLDARTSWPGPRPALTVVQVREFVELGKLDPEGVVTPGIFVDRVVRVAA